MASIQTEVAAELGGVYLADPVPAWLDEPEEGIADPTPPPNPEPTPEPDPEPSGD